MSGDWAEAALTCCPSCEQWILRRQCSGSRTCSLTLVSVAQRLDRVVGSDAKLHSLLREAPGQLGEQVGAALRDGRCHGRSLGPSGSDESVLFEFPIGPGDGARSDS